MKKTSRFAAACVAGALATGLAVAPASAQDFAPSGSSQAIGDALVNSTEPLFRLSASMFSKQCNFVTTSNCTR